MANDTTTPMLLITNVGLEAASRAKPEGPYIHIVKFEIGSAYGYTPDVNQTELRGQILYGGDPNPSGWARPTTYRYIGNNTTNIICEIPPEAGPWEFGEVGLFAEDQTGTPYLFAIAVFQSPQTKFSSLGTNVISSYTLNCLIKLQQSVAIFKIDTANGSPTVLDIYQWSDIYPPSLSADPDVQIYNVRELSSRGESSLVSTANDNHRSLVYGAYEEIWGAVNVVPSGPQFIVQAADTTWIEVQVAQFNPNRYDFNNRSLLVSTQAGFWRSVANIAQNGNNLRLNLNCTNDGTYNNYPLPIRPNPGEAVHIYADYLSGRAILYSQIVNPPSIPPAQPGVPGLATAGNGLYVAGAGVLAAAGMLHAPSQNTGRVLGSGDNLSAEGAQALPSGVYSVIGEMYGIPNGYPLYPPAPTNNATIYHTNVPDAMTQLLIPYNPPNKMQYRCTLNGDTNWGPWITITDSNSRGNTGQWVTRASGTGTFTETNNTGFSVMYAATCGSAPDNPIALVLTINGVRTQEQRANNHDSAKQAAVTTIVPPGATINMYTYPWGYQPGQIKNMDVFSLQLPF
jgi:hypothetical protein